MTARSWNDGVTADFNDPSAWTPLGVPQAGDSLTVAHGNPAASNVTLGGYTILLGGSGGSPGPAQIVTYTDETQGPGGAIASGFTRVPAPNPTLTLANATIGPNTTVSVPATPALLRGLPADTATIFVQGHAENDGTIEMGGGPLSIGGTLNISMDSGYGTLENRGTITIGSRSDLVLSGYDSNSSTAFPSVGTLSNDGAINVYGSVLDTSLGLSGTGTINLDSAPGFLGLPSTPGRFEYVGVVPGAGQSNVVFHGGQLILDAAAYFSGTLSNFGMDPTDLIQLTDLPVVSSSYANGVLTLHSSQGFVTNLDFSGLPAGTFQFTPHGNGTDITFLRFPTIPIPIHI